MQAPPKPAKTEARVEAKAGGRAEVKEPAE
jgi:hypothetical protein